MSGQLQFSLQAKRIQALNVTQLVRLVRDSLELNLDEYWVVGEASNVRLAPSNHLYFTLKDSRSAINAVMFRTAAERLRFNLTDGTEVMVRGRVSVYESRGTLQLYAEELQPRGLGALQLAYEQLKERLGAAGLFNEQRKRQIPFLPRAIGLVTALGGAALKDMLTTILARFPNSRVIIRPAKVQGQGAAIEIAEALDDLNRHGVAETIIVGRGGGSLEDLWAFNEEIVARAIFRSKVPVISAVGHEIDYTISDFVADMRAPTPTAAGQLVVPSKAELLQRIADAENALGGALRGIVATQRRHLSQLSVRIREPRLLLRQGRQRLDECSTSLRSALQRQLNEKKRLVVSLSGSVKAPLGMIRESRRRAENLATRLVNGTRNSLTRSRERLAFSSERLDSVSPLKVLARGYAVAVNLKNGRAITDASTVDPGDELEVRVSQGRLRARTTSREA